jgi:hypothetical protein
MLRLLKIVACLLISVNCFADNYVRVTSEGSTIAEAKNNAFREAVQIKVGAVVLSEQELTNNNLRNNISVYSAGYIEDYKIVSSSVNTNGARITMDVLVASSKLLDQTLNTGKTNNYIDGYNAGISVDTYRSQKNDAYKVLRSVLNTYPQNAYVIKTQPYRFVINKFQDSVIEVPYQLNWNYDYITAFNEVMDVTQDVKFRFLQSAPSNVITMAKNPKDYLIGNKNHYKFNDLFMTDMIKASMLGEREVRIKMVLRDGNNNILYNSCWIPDSVTGRKSPFYSLGEPNNILIYGNESETNVLRATINREYEWIIHKINSIEVSVVPHRSC